METCVTQKAHKCDWISCVGCRMEFERVDLAQYVMEVVATKCPLVHVKPAVPAYVFWLVGGGRRLVRFLSLSLHGNTRQPTKVLGSRGELHQPAYGKALGALVNCRRRRRRRCP